MTTKKTALVPGDLLRGARMGIEGRFSMKTIKMTMMKTTLIS